MANENKDTDVLELTCKRCGTVYRVGEDAAVVAKEHVIARYVEQGSDVTIISDDGSMQLDPDVVRSIESTGAAELEERKKIAQKMLADVVRDLKKGVKRRWWCMKCMNHDSPYEYPRIS